MRPQALTIGIAIGNKFASRVALEYKAASSGHDTGCCSWHQLRLPPHLALSYRIPRQQVGTALRRGVASRCYQTCAFSHVGTGVPAALRSLKFGLGYVTHVVFSCRQIHKIGFLAE